MAIHPLCNPMTEFGWIAVGAIVAILGALRAAFSPCGQSMLASLTPYAEAARGSRWVVTSVSFSIGAVIAGACGGLMWGGLGSLLPAGEWRLVAAAIVLALALVIDASSLRKRLPLTKRQVNEDWMVTYRGWVYGVGFGAQLGLGFITLVACAAIYATFAIEFLSGSIVAGAAIGATFGAAKAASLLPAGWATDRHSLVGLHRRLLTLEPLSIGAVAIAEVAAVVIVVGAMR
jgi:MFS family permease